MSKHHPKNERIKHKYLAFLEEAKRLSEKSADIAAAAIADFEKSTGYKDFKAFHIEQARKYKRVLSEAINPKTKKPLAKATIHSRLSAVKAFFQWLAGQPGYKQQIRYSDCEYFNLSANDSHIARAKRPAKFPTLDQVILTIFSMPFETDIEKRNRAMVAFTLLTGARVDALASFKISNVSLKKRLVFQDARNVKTKFRKSGQTSFFPVGEEIEAIFAGWFNYLVNELHFTGSDPLFPRTLIGQNQANCFAVLGLSREHWQSTGSIRDIFKAAFAEASLPYFNPHSIRHTLAQFGEQVCRTPEEFKAWSQNMSHENVLTTFTSYGEVSHERQAELIGKLGSSTEGQMNTDGEPDAETIAQVVNFLNKKVVG